MPLSGKSLGLLIVAALGLLGARAEEKPAAASLFDDPVIARGQGVEIKRSQLDDAFIAFKANLVARNQTLPEEQRLFRQAQLLDRLITTKLLVNRATDADNAKAKELAKKFAEEARKSAPSEELFGLQLKALGLSPEQFHQRIMEQAVAEAVIERELKPKVSVSEAQVKDFYTNGTDLLVKIMQEEHGRLGKIPTTTLGQLGAVTQQIEELKKANLARLEQPEKVRVSHVLLATRKRETEEELPEDQKKIKRFKIEELLKRARSGEDFSKLVMEYSEDRGLKESKGEYTFSRNDPFVPEFKAAAFSLQTNQISDIVTTTFGYHIIRLLEKIPAKKLEFEKVSADIKDALLQQELQNQMPAYLESIKKSSGIEILETKYKLDAPKAGSQAKSGN